ncbi:MAG: hypothetical protein LBH18_03495 [Spirochaetaceae bacterium]|jgi:hypothetical protein|nr:hypothetical protein [Spirochaetaceae bacterium]
MKINKFPKIKNLKQPFSDKFCACTRADITNDTDGGRKMKRIGLLIALSFIGVMLCYSEQKEFYREFRYRIIEEDPKDTLKMKTPPMFISNSYSIIHEYRKVNSNKGLGGGGWKRIEVYKANIQPTYYDVENLFKELPASWMENGYRASLMPTIDNRSFWWASDGTFHYYVAYRKIG